MVAEFPYESPEPPGTALIDVEVGAGAAGLPNKLPPNSPPEGSPGPGAELVLVLETATGVEVSNNFAPKRPPPSAGVVEASAGLEGRPNKPPPSADVEGAITRISYMCADDGWLTGSSSSGIAGGR